MRFCEYLAACIDYIDLHIHINAVLQHSATSAHRVRGPPPPHPIRPSTRAHPTTRMSIHASISKHAQYYIARHVSSLPRPLETLPGMVLGKGKLPRRGHVTRHPPASPGQELCGAASCTSPIRVCYQMWSVISRNSTDMVASTPNTAMLRDSG